MIKYHLMRLASEPRDIGVRNGIYQARIVKSCFKDKDLYDKIEAFFMSYDSWSRHGQVPDFDVDLQCVKLLKSAKVTSFLRYMHNMHDCPFLISREALQVFSKFNIQEHYLYRARVYASKDELLDYQLFYCPTLGHDVIDYPKSVLYNPVEKTRVIVRSHSEYREQAERCSYLTRFEKIVLNERFDRQLDFFILWTTEMYVSERLCAAMTKRGLTGVYLEPAYGEGLAWPAIEVA